MKNRKLETVLGLIFGMMGLGFFIWQMCCFIYFPQSYFDKNPNVTIYYDRNIVSPWANFLFFTNQTLIFFSIWCLLIGISGVIKNEKLRNFTLSQNVMSFVFTNYVITTLLYTIMELLGKREFGLWGTSLDAWGTFFRNVMIHYVFFIVCTIMFVKIKPTSSYDRRVLIFGGVYLLLYYSIARIVGRYCFVVEWYPYMFFHSEVLWKFLGLGVYNKTWALVIMIVVMFLICCLYFTILILVNHFKNKIVNNS